MDNRLEYRLRYSKSPEGTSDTRVYIDESRGKVSLSDWDLNKSLNDMYGDSDMEWFYEFQIEDIQRLNQLLLGSYEMKDILYLSDNEKNFLDLIVSKELKQFIQILFIFMEKNNGGNLASLAEKNNIRVIRSSF